MTTTLYYVTDPMCSWCYGFAPAVEAIRAALPDRVRWRYVMGGLAPDSDEPMPEAIRGQVMQAWGEVAARTGATFNWDFWTTCAPRRSTYPACRAVIAAGLQGADAAEAMFRAVQRAYYTEARNPSDDQVLIALADETGSAIAGERFRRDLVSTEVRELFAADLELARRLGAHGFPSVVLERDDAITPLLAGWVDSRAAVSTVVAAVTG